MASNFDNSAWFYDRLSRMVYGKSLVRAQVYLLKYIPQRANILIAGGGTGWILSEIANIRPRGLTITYVEISSKMMALSRQRISGENTVIFIHGPVENVKAAQLFDMAITPFLFDNFTQQTLETVFLNIHRQLKPKGLWLNTDFQLTGKWWQRFLLESMLFFFRVICRIEARKLPDIGGRFERYHYREKDKKTFFGEFISSVAYQKP